jgi:2Fe-2S ferredoxin
MVKITFIEHDGETRTVDARENDTLMQVATENGVRGILGECGGSCACGTCHCFVEERMRAHLGEPGSDEVMLVSYSEHFRPESRLGCQIRVTGALDGMVVRLPPSQP